MAKGRREPSPSPTEGIFTRSRAEIFLHRTRSGRARSDPTRRQSHLLIPISPTAATAGASAPDEGAIDGAATIRISIKDLRVRRVFSPTSISPECSPDQPGKIKPRVDQMDNIEGSEKEETGEQRNRDVVEALPGSDVTGKEKWVQATPPDNDFLRKLDEGDRRGAVGFDAEGKDRVVKVSRGDRRTTMTSRRLELGYSKPSKNKQTIQMKDNIFKGIAACSRSKLYRNPSSFGYRRLLPYLMDQAKDRSGGVEIPHCHNYHVEAEKSMEERLPLLTANPPSEQKDHTANSEDSPTVLTRGNLDIAKNPVSKNPKLGTSEDAIEDLTVIESRGSCSERVLQVHRVMNDALLRSCDLDLELLHKSSHCPSTDREALSVEELAGDVQDLSYLSRKAEKGRRIVVPTLEMDKKHPLGASQLRKSGPIGNRALAPKKCILKRHTRGCRGLCMCLDCASFRVHAERAYEFSRKQMQEVDEVITGLVKELSSLRNIMKKSVRPFDDGAGNNAVLQTNMEQVKRAYQRAFKAEELGKKCMKEMFHELNIHCRNPQGRRVRFAECVEEKCIP